MNYHWNYGDRVLNLPAAALDAGADAEQLQVLVFLASGIDDLEEIGAKANVTERTIRDALAFWENTGILSAGDATATSKNKKKIAKKDAEQSEKDNQKAQKKLMLSNELPTYSIQELNRIMDRKESFRTMANEAQQIFGKMFSVHDYNVLLGMVDYLGLDEEYILLLLEHCVRIGIKGMRTVFNYAVGLIDQGITSADGFEEQLKAIETRHSLEGKIRELFGMKSRSLTSKEKGYLDTWNKFGYGEDVIRRAYEITVDNINEPSMRYTHAILDRWHAEGLKNLEEIDRFEKEKRAKGRGIDRNLVKGTSSFDTEEFFEAALKRSYKSATMKTQQEEHKEK